MESSKRSNDKTEILELFSYEIAWDTDPPYPNPGFVAYVFMSRNEKNHSYPSSFLMKQENINFIKQQLIKAEMT